MAVKGGDISFFIEKSRENRMPFKKAIYFSLFLHCAAFLFFVVTTTETEVVRERRVRLVLKNSVVGKDIIKDARQSAPDKKSDDGSIFDKNFFKKYDKARNERSSYDTEPNANKRVRRRKTDDFFKRDFDRRKNPNSRDSKHNPDIKHNNSNSRDRFADNKDSLGRLTRGRDSLPGKRVVNPNRGNGSQSRSGKRGNGISGQVNVRGRRVIHRPGIRLPAKYSQMGLSFTVRVAVVVNSDGIVVSARPLYTTGQIELERILVQYARRFRFEQSPGASNQSGTITFYIRPR